MSVEITAVQEALDQSTARAVLNRVRDDLSAAVLSLTGRTDHIHSLIIATRPSGLLTVDEMAEALGRDRNYVDSVWSASKSTTVGKQTRVPVSEHADPEKARWSYEALSDAAAELVKARSTVVTARSARDRAVVSVYASKLLGPSAIAAEVGIDRNHVLRIARKAGVKPVHRTGSKNQYSSGK